MLANIAKLLSQYGDLFRSGLSTTLLLSVQTILIGTALGTVICVLRMSRVEPLRWVCAAYIEIIRGLPLLLQLYIFVFLLPRLLRTGMTNLQAVGLSLALSTSAYISEIIRAGIQAVDTGQSEAARSLGLSSGQALRRVVLPQAVTNILPALGNEFTVVIKNTSLASAFFVGDLMTVQKNVTGSLFMTMEPMLIVGVIYFSMTFTLSKLVALYERRVRTA